VRNRRGSLYQFLPPAETQTGGKEKGKKRGPSQRPEARSSALLSGPPGGKRGGEKIISTRAREPRVLRPAPLKGKKPNAVAGLPTLFPPFPLPERKREEKTGLVLFCCHRRRRREGKGGEVSTRPPPPSRKGEERTKGGVF